MIIMSTFPEFIKKRPRVDLPYQSVNGYLIQGNHEQVVFMAFDRDTVVPEHSHASQWELVVEGTVDLTLNGKTTTYSKGGCFFIPKDAPHAAVVHKGYHCVMIFDQRDRYHVKHGTK